ncbi:MAG: hypothetical protein PQ975_11610 [Methanobacterium sp.]|jgi:ABC-type phosphate transport system substrate-binding protein
MKKQIMLFTIAFVFAIVICGAVSANETHDIGTQVTNNTSTFIIDGGSTLVPVAKSLGQVFTERTGVTVTVNMSTTGQGIRAAGEDRVNIGMGG